MIADHSPLRKDLYLTPSQEKRFEYVLKELEESEDYERFAEEIIVLRDFYRDMQNNAK